MTRVFMTRVRRPVALALAALAVFCLGVSASAATATAAAASRALERAATALRSSPVYVDPSRGAPDLERRGRPAYVTPSPGTAAASPTLRSSPARPPTRPAGTRPPPRARWRGRWVGPALRRRDRQQLPGREQRRRPAGGTGRRAGARGARRPSRRGRGQRAGGLRRTASARRWVTVASRAGRPAAAATPGPGSACSCSWRCSPWRSAASCSFPVADAAARRQSASKRSRTSPARIWWRSVRTSARWTSTSTCRASTPAKRDYERALDCYQKADEAWNEARRPQDLEHVTALLEEGRYGMVSTHARLEGRRPPPERRAPCFFDPRHGSSTTDVEWAPPGGDPRPVPACAADAQRVRDGVEPDARQVAVGGHTVPYWNAGPAYAPGGRLLRRRPAPWSLPRLDAQLGRRVLRRRLRGYGAGYEEGWEDRGDQGVLRRGR